MQDMNQFYARMAAAVVLGAVAAAASAQVGVSVNIGEPGFYGQINIGAAAPPPAVIYSRPVIIDSVPESLGPPMYLRVPPGHEKHWAKHCAEYHACGHQVYFVRDDWYQRNYGHHHEDGDEDGDHWHDHGDHGDHGHGHGHGHGHD
jgi:hypothetical protein